MASQIKLNGVTYAIAMVKGKPRINGMTTGKFIKHLAKTDKTALKDFLALAVQVTMPSLMLPIKK